MKTMVNLTLLSAYISSGSCLSFRFNQFQNTHGEFPWHKIGCVTFIARCLVIKIDRTRFEHKSNRGEKKKKKRKESRIYVACLYHMAHSVSRKSMFFILQMLTRSLFLVNDFARLSSSLLPEN